MLWKLTAGIQMIKYSFALLALLAADLEPAAEPHPTPARSPAARSTSAPAASPVFTFSAGDGFPLVVPDRLVDGKYIVFLIGPREAELAVPVTACLTGRAGPWCPQALRQDAPGARARIEDKLDQLRARGRPRRARLRKQRPGPDRPV